MKIKRQSTKGSGVILKWHSGLLCLALSLPARLAVRGSLSPSWAGQSCLLCPTQQIPRAVPSFNQNNDLQHDLQLLFLLLSSASLLCTSGRSPFTVAVSCLTSILCLDFNRSLLPSNNCRLWVSCWSNSLSNQIKSLKHKRQSFLPTAPSHSKGFHFPLTLAHHSPGENTHPLFCTCLWRG